MDEKLKYALEHTELIRPPQQTLATFGTTIIDYYVLTSLIKGVNVVREGKVTAEKPRIVTPAYLFNVEGFSEPARRYVETMAREHPGEPGIFYRYKNELKEMNVVSEPMGEMIGKINARIDEQRNPLSTIIKGVEELWDVSLLMFIYELTRRSFYANVTEFQRRGSLDVDSIGVPRDARNHIEELFERARKDISRAPELVLELNRWGLFSEYQDRFFSLFRR